MGFAGALKEIGLPVNNSLIALFTFNVGVEIGQLFVISATWLIYKLWCRWWQMDYNPRNSILYIIGGFSMFWTVSRVINIFA